MSREICFSLNRWILITVLAGAMLIPVTYLPLLHTPVRVELIPEFSSNNILIENIPVSTNGGSIQSSTVGGQDKSELTIKLADILKYLYLTGIFFSLVLFIKKILEIFLLIRKSTIIKKDGYRLVLTNHDIVSFAFARSIIISKSDYEDFGSSILPHEMAHIRLNHFFDLIFLELVKAFHWFNPAVYGIIRNMKEIHEFQADAYTIRSGVDASQYQLLLIKKSVGAKNFALANNFNHCQIKKRITMMNKQKNNKAWRWKVAIFLPMLAFLLMAFGKKNENLPEPVVLNENGKMENPVVTEITQDRQYLTDQIIHIKSEGNYINNKACSLQEITLQDKKWREASNKWILLLIDESIPYNRVDEVREALIGSYWVVQTTVGSDDYVFFAGDVSEAAKFKQGNWNEWMKNQLEKNIDTKSKTQVSQFSYSFIINKNGKVRDAHIIKKSDDPEINAALEKILTQIPDWEPARRGSDRANVYCKYLFGVKVVEN